MVAATGGGRLMRWVLGVVLLLAAADAHAQKRPATPQPANPLPARTVMIGGGMAWPLTHDGVTRYWRAGPAAAVEFDVRVRRRFLVGVGIDVGAFWFRASRFIQSNPGVALHNIPVAQITIALTGRMELFPEKRISPSLGLSIGVSRLTAAVYRQEIDSVRVTWFSIPGRTRLSVGGIAGVTFRATRWLGIDAESRLLYIHNDPDAGLMLLLRAGLRFAI